LEDEKSFRMLIGLSFQIDDLDSLNKKFRVLCSQMFFFEISYKILKCLKRLGNMEEKLLQYFGHIIHNISKTSDISKNT